MSYSVLITVREKSLEDVLATISNINLTLKDKKIENVRITYYDEEDW